MYNKLMATTQQTNTKQLPSFSEIKPYEQLAVILRSQNVSAKDNADQINGEFRQSFKPQTIYDWFMKGGKLEAAYEDYTTQVGNETVEEAKRIIKHASLIAAQTLIDLTGEEYPPNIRLQAAKTLLNKTMPDGSLAPTGATDSLDDYLSDEQIAKGIAILKGEDVDDLVTAN